MLWVASGVLLLVLPFLLWPLLFPPPGGEGLDSPPPRGEGREGVAGATDREQVLHAIEEVELDAASGRLDQAEASRRLAELRVEAEEVLRRK